ncbi:MAG: hypothetical protein NXH90_03820 [Flavobacteriaceae bacterium]|nr:hypothetical protein [Flavobacteriaceae bacterium]
MDVRGKAKAAIDGFAFNEENIDAFNESAGTELTFESLKTILKMGCFYYLVPEFEISGSEEEVPLGKT